MQHEEQVRSYGVSVQTKAISRKTNEMNLTPIFLWQYVLSSEGIAHSDFLPTDLLIPSKQPNSFYWFILAGFYCVAHLPCSNKTQY